MKAKGCLIAAAVAFGLMTILIALVAPTVWREGGRIIAPIAEIKSAQDEFEAWSEQHPFKAPESVAVTPEQLDRFLKLRKLLSTLEEKSPLSGEAIERDRAPTFAEVGALIQGVGGSVAAQMAAHRDVSMPPSEYSYLERVVYRLWLRPLRAKALDPGSVSRAAKEIADLATAEKDAAVARRLRGLAQSLAERRVPVPEGFPKDVHDLLMSRVTDIEGLIDAGSAIPMRGGRRSRIEF